MSAMSAPTAIRKRLIVSEFDRNSTATVTLDGETVATLTRTPGFIFATTLGEPWGGGRNLDNALRAVASAYVQIKGRAVPA